MRDDGFFWGRNGLFKPGPGYKELWEHSTVSERIGMRVGDWFICAVAVVLLVKWGFWPFAIWIGLVSAYYFVRLALILWQRRPKEFR